MSTSQPADLLGLPRDPPTSNTNSRSNSTLAPRLIAERNRAPEAMTDDNRPRDRPVPLDKTLLKAWQINLHNSQRALDILTRHLDEDQQVSVVAVSEPPWFLRRGGSIPRFRNIRALASEAESTLALLLIREDVEATQIPVDCDRLAVARLDLAGRQQLTLLSAYIQPVTGLGWTALRRWLDLYIGGPENSSFHPIWIAGDFNSRHPLWGPPSSPTTNVAEALIAAADAFQLRLLNKFPSSPTFSSSAGDSHIDLTWCKDITSIDSWQVRDDLETLSDHKIVETQFRPPGGQLRLGSRRRNWRHAQWDKIDKAFAAEAPHWVSPAALQATNSAAAFESQVKALEEAIRKAAHPWVPLGRPSSFRKHWWNDKLAQQHTNLKRAKRRGERHRRQFGHVPTPLAEDIASKRDQLRQAIQARKREAWREFLVENTGCTRDLWSTYKRLTKPGKTQPISFLTTEEDGIIEDPQLISAKLFGKFCPDGPPLNWNRTFCDDDEAIPPVSIAEARESFLGGRPYAAPGPDGLPKAAISRAFRHAPETFAQLASTSLRLGVLPVTWQRATVVCIPKKPNPRNTLACLRPISLIGAIAKSIHQIVHHRLAQYLEVRQLLSPRQFGFRVGRGTEEALIAATTFVESNIRQHRAVYGITLDIKAAFDSLRPAVVLEQLMDWRVPRYLINWVASFFQNRELVIDLEGGSFGHRPSVGTPQGSPLSPLLFCIGIDSVLRLPLMPGTHIQAYADDLLLLGTDEFEERTQTKLQHALDRLDTEARSKGLSFAPQKCYQIRFESKIRRIAPRPLHINGQQLPQQKAVLYLGIWFDMTLSWTEQVHYAAKKVRGRLDQIRRFTGPFWGMLPAAVEKLVHMAIEPAAYYGAVVWQSVAYSARTLAPLEKAIRQACLLLAGAFRTTSYPSAFALSGVRPPTQQIIMQSLYYESRRRQKDAYAGWPSARQERSAGQSYRRIAWSRWQRSLPIKTQGSCGPLQRDWSPIPPHHRQLLDGTMSIPETERPDWLLTVALGRNPDKHSFGTCWILTSEESEFRESWWDPDWASEEEAIMVGLRNGLDKLMERTADPQLQAVQTLGIVTDTIRHKKTALRLSNVSETATQIQRRLIKWADTGHLVFWTTSTWKPGLSPFLATQQRALRAASEKEGLPKGTALSRSWQKIKIAAYLNQAALQDIKSREQSAHLTQHLGRFCKGHFPAKYLDRDPASRLSQFTANHFPSRQYLHRFGQLDAATGCPCGARLEDRDHLLLECPSLLKARRRLEGELDGPLSIACAFTHPEALSEFVEVLAKQWQETGRRWGR